MTMDWWLGYLLAAILISLSPGSGAINTMSSSISYGFNKTLASIAGLQVGLIVHIILVGIGLGTLIAHSVLAFDILKWLGAAYLIWLGIQQWRAAGAIDMNAVSQVMPRSHLFKRAVFVNLTNPKGIVFLAALFPQFILHNQPQVPQYLILGATTIAVDIVVMLGYATLAKSIAVKLRSARQMQILNRIFGSIFIIIAVLLATTKRT